MVLKLDPRIPAVWRDPFSLQFGIGDPIAVLRDVSEATERMVSALASGISRSGLEMTGRASGATDTEIDALIATLSPVLLGDPVEHHPTVLIAGSGPIATHLAADLAASGTRVRIATSSETAASEPCDFAVIVAAFVIAPEYHALWLRRDVRHLPVVINDTHVVIGPVVEPGNGPCLHCLNRYKAETDAAWPAIALQLMGRQAVAETALVASEAAAIASRMAVRALAGAVSSGQSMTLNVASGATSTRTWLPHPACGCISLDQEALQRHEHVDPASGLSPRGSDSPAVGHHGVATLQPTTGLVASGRE